ncbi:MAG: DEAD/DEAH box helicase family protein [Acidiferrobacterales bacterium]|nr:DEAD/DEAH box helicase family protein [Acidiferrobacterales bacterium]
MSQSLTQKFDGLDELRGLENEIPTHITNNLAPLIKLRPYQEGAVKRWLYYMDNYGDRPSNPHLLFHMATGSGKTVLMATLILDLYQRGYRNFMFFVNSTQIIEKTKDNFLNPSSSKHLFSSHVRINEKPVKIHAVDVFDAASSESINIHFTSVQGLHSRMREPQENAVTIEDFRDHKVVMISDEAHHLNAETKNRLNQGETERKESWENTVNAIFNQHNENVLLEFTATVDLEHEAILKKYRDKILYDYSLRKFREDGYSKDITLRQVDLPPRERMMQAIILSQYRRKVAEHHGLHCKPVILMKSRTIEESNSNHVTFTEMVRELSGDVLENLRLTSESTDETISKAFAFILDERGAKASDFVLELQGDFGGDKVVNVNKPEDLEKRQIDLNTLEDRSNELRVIFAVDKLNEGWDVLNLFDIVRLYDTRDARDNKVGKTTMAEAQLIGRGARYFPFTASDQLEATPEKRKYDSDVMHPLRIIEELHYHCSHNPKYIQEINMALRETGLLDETEKKVELRLKDSFKKTSLYSNGYVWTNERIKNTRENIKGLPDYDVDVDFAYPRLMTGRVTENSVFGTRSTKGKDDVSESITKNFNLKDFGNAILRFAMDANSFFHFTSLKFYFPHLVSESEFRNSDSYLGGVKVAVEGKSENLESLNAHQKLEISHYVLRQIENSVKRQSIDYIGTKVFEARKISDCFTDKTLKLRTKGESGRSWNESEISGLNQIDLTNKDWHVYDDNYGTDQEKHFIKFLNDRVEQLRNRYDEIFLLRNEKAVKLFAFDNGQGFEPDFVLFLQEKEETSGTTVLQLFIEPKGDHLKQHDSWKEEFLKTIEIVIQGRDYTVYGLPFFNASGQSRSDFDEAFNQFLNDG